MRKAPPKPSRGPWASSLDISSSHYSLTQLHIKVSTYASSRLMKKIRIDARSMPEHDCHHSENETARNALLQQVAALESEMEDTRAQMAQKETLLQMQKDIHLHRLLQQERQRRRLDSELNLLSPIDQLPAEIKTEIFYSALCPLARGGKNPFLLGKICRGWRGFVWSSPVLWTNINLRVSRRNGKSQTNLLQDWLSRTAGYPLNFCLAAGWSNGGSSYKKILTMLASVSTQWKDVEFFLPDGEDCFNAISTAENSFPLLTAATVHFESGEQPFTLFSVAPQLSMLCIKTIHRLAEVLAPWHQLKEFISHDIQLHEVRELLQKAPNIIRCTLNCGGSSVQGQPQDVFVRPLVLEHLEYLNLGIIGVGTTQILKSVKLPSLREVYLRNYFVSSSPTANFTAIMISFCSSHLLKKVTLTGEITSDDELIQVLGYVPSTTELCLDFRTYWQRAYPPLTERLLQRLYPPNADILLPNLRRLTYFGPSTLNEHMHLLRDVLVYRFRQCALRPAEVDSKRATVSQIQSVTGMVGYGGS